ncbi:MAG: deoxynucleoside kinase [Clostridia bacterium]
MLVCIEGMDGVGKTSIIDILKKELDFKKYEKSIENLLNLDFSKCKDITYNVCSNYSKKVEAMYFLLGFMTVYEKSREENIIMDRGILSTYYFSNNNDSNFLFESFFENKIYPDLNIILYADIEERIKRIISRNPDDEDLLKKRIYKNGYDKYFECISKYDLNSIIINNTNMTLEETANICKRIIKIIITNQCSELLNILSIKNIELQKNICYNEFESIVSNYEQEKIKKR